MVRSSQSNASRGDEISQLREELQLLREDNEKRLKEQLNRIKDLEHIDELRDSFGSFEFKDVVFNAVAGADTEITHSLNPADPESVKAIPVMWEFITIPVESPYIYRPAASNRRPWGSGYIILRCNIASAVVRMLLVTESR